LSRLDAVRATRAPTTLVAQQAAYADAVLRAAVDAAQDERDEMQVYLTHARTLASSLSLGGVEWPWPLPVDVVAGELWLEVDRFAEARDSFASVSSGLLADRAMAGLGHALERLGDTTGACAAYRRAAASALVDARRAQASEAASRLACPR
jgi:hypothetical protein